jgi:hypothetical protein
VRSTDNDAMSRAAREAGRSEESSTATPGVAV